MLPFQRYWNYGNLSLQYLRLDTIIITPPPPPPPTTTTTTLGKDEGMLKDKTMIKIV